MRVNKPEPVENAAHGSPKLGDLERELPKRKKQLARGNAQRLIRLKRRQKPLGV